MCFTLGWSVGIFTFQLAVAACVWLRCERWPSRVPVALLILWFALMEFIQILNYLVGLEDAPWDGGCVAPPFQNKLLVVLGYTHVCFQPLATHYLLYLGRVNEYGQAANERFVGVLRMLVIAAMIDLSGMLEALLLGAQGS